MKFRGPYAFLSNFHPSPVLLDGESYPTVEHAYQAAKTLDAADRARIRNSASPVVAKRQGKRVILRADWDDVKLSVMEGLLRQKFRRGTVLGKALVATGDVELVEDNAWGDRYWGRCKGTGQNHLGRLLMAIRTKLAAVRSGSRRGEAK